MQQDSRRTSRGHIRGTWHSTNIWKNHQQSFSGLHQHERTTNIDSPGFRPSTVLCPLLLSASRALATFRFEYDFLVRPNSWQEFAKLLSDHISWPSSCLLRELLEISWSAQRVQKLTNRTRSQSNQNVTNARPILPESVTFLNFWWINPRGNGSQLSLYSRFSFTLLPMITSCVSNLYKPKRFILTCIARNRRHSWDSCGRYERSTESVYWLLPLPLGTERVLLLPLPLGTERVLLLPLPLGTERVQRLRGGNEAN